MSRRMLVLFTIVAFLAAFSYALAQRVPNGSDQPGQPSSETRPGDVAQGIIMNEGNGELRLNIAEDPCDPGKVEIKLFTKPYRVTPLPPICPGQSYVQVEQQK